MSAEIVRVPFTGIKVMILAEVEATDWIVNPAKVATKTAVAR